MIRRLAWPLGVAVLTAAYALLPLLGSKEVYLRGDSAAQFAPTWWYLGTMVRENGWPVDLDPTAWAGGNFFAEALFGVWNPLNLLIWLFVSGTADLLVAVTAVKVAILVALALGTYVLCREYDARPWAAAVVATALPFSGFTLWWDAGSWPAGLLAFAYAPWVWWAFRRVMRGTMNPFWGFLVGALGVTQGNPYGTLAVVVAGGALIVEGLVTRQRAGALKLLLTGGFVACLLPLVYLPLLRASELAARSSGPLIANNGKMRPELGDLLGMSSPTFVPGIESITGATQVPVTYFCWFLLPLLPWLHYRILRSRARELTGLAIVGIVYLLATLGPSNMWLFRWPLRLIEYFYLGLGVAFAIVLSQGLARDHVRRRVVGTALIVVALGFQTWAQHPTWTAQTLGGALLLALLTTLLLLAHRSTRSTAAITAVLIGGTGVVLAAQALVYEENNGARIYHVPTDVAALQEDFGDLEGRVMQFADLRPQQAKAQATGNDRPLRRAWENFLPGSMYHVADVSAVNNYTGMGFRPFERRLCLHYEGFTRPCGYQRVWKPLEKGEPRLVDLMKIETVVAQPDQTVGVTPPRAWRYVETGDRIVLERRTELPWPHSELSAADDGIEVGDTLTDGTTEYVEVESAPRGGTLTFALLNWPGYTAVLDGEELEVDQNRAGLVTVDLPRGAEGELELSYDRPGRAVANAGVVVGVLGALLLGIVSFVIDRRRRRTTGGEGADEAPDEGGDEPPAAPGAEVTPDVPVDTPAEDATPKATEIPVAPDSPESPESPGRRPAKGLTLGLVGGAVLLGIATLAGGRRRRRPLE